MGGQSVRVGHVAYDTGMKLLPFFASDRDKMLMLIDDLGRTAVNGLPEPPLLSRRSSSNFMPVEIHACIFRDMFSPESSQYITWFVNVFLAVRYHSYRPLPCIILVV